MIKSKSLLKILLFVLVVPVLVFTSAILLVYWKQDSIVQEVITSLNSNYKGEIIIKDSHISPFANFPYVSIDLEELKIYEEKGRAGKAVLEVRDAYIGFDVWSLLQGVIEIKSLKLSDGALRLIQFADGSFNISNAFSSDTEDTDEGEDLNLDIQKIELNNINVWKLNEENNVLIEADINRASAKFKSTDNHILLSLQSQFLLNVLIDNDTTFIKRKHFEIKTQLDFIEDIQLLVVHPSEVLLEKVMFKMDGSIDFDDDLNLDLRFQGDKPDFDLFLAFAPEELTPALQRYENAGKIFFVALVSGKSINGHNPFIMADFGCEDAFFSNMQSKKRVDDLYFRGHFSNGEERNIETMEFSLTDFVARPETGNFSAELYVKNFISPDIEMKVRSDFDLEFLADFFNITEIENLRGQVSMTMNFHDIIDLQHPEKSIEKLNESYFTELDVKNLGFKLPGFHLPVEAVNIKATMDGHEANINHFSIKLGNSDLSFSASVSDLPAILHHTNIPVTADMLIKSNLLDIYELTSGDTLNRKPVNEQIKDLSMKLKFVSSAKAITESPNLPVGEFFIEDLFAQLTHYPHQLHDFHADVYIDDNDFRVIDFTGMIDKSDFHFSGKLKNYALWLKDEPSGENQIEFNFTSDLLQLEDLFSYGGENFVPEDYRHEQFSQVKLHGFANLQFEKRLKSAFLDIDKIEARMKVHAMRFEQFKGKLYYQDDHLVVENFGGKLGNSDFTVNLNLHLANTDSLNKAENYFSLSAKHLDFDQLFSYTPAPANTVMTPEDHENVFNIYDLPFANMRADLDIKRLTYHRYLLENFFVKSRMQQDHYIYLDTLSLQAAGGNIFGKGYFNGSDRDKIYFHADLNVTDLELDKIMFKFENFGQDHLVSENLHGKFSGSIKGLIRMHADMVPIIDDADLSLDILVVNGRLERYAALNALSDYFKDKNLSRVRFDTLKNILQLNKGTLTVPRMNINSSLGFIEISGKQDLDMNMDYFLRIPLSMVTQVGMSKLFGRNRTADEDADDEIQIRDANKRVRFVNLRITGNPDTYNISLGRDKSN
ncbi:MAG TPA: AsmA-like C-terminal region-containing protein [Cyclobacteriaceae bacterium]|nr:AsmA-like C-terminal region-containing protein [Cyclobacteriaceae bacterium]